MHPTVAETRNFLSKVRSAIHNKNYMVLDSRRKYRETLAALGISEEDVLDDILHLTERDHWKKDNDKDSVYPGQVWKCIKNLHGSDIYIKLKIKIDENGKLLIMSYHFGNMQ